MSDDTDGGIAIDAFNRLDSHAAAVLLTACCGARRWIVRMVNGRPYDSLKSILEQADDCWWSLDASDWREAFAHHPRIGEQTDVVSQNGRASRWSVREQSGMDAAHEDVRDAIAEANRAYEERFGYTYIVYATGKTSEEMLALVRTRLHNAPDVELRVAAEEQRQITRLRLTTLFADDGSTS